MSSAFGNTLLASTVGPSVRCQLLEIDPAGAGSDVGVEGISHHSHVQGEGEGEGAGCCGGGGGGCGSGGCGNTDNTPSLPPLLYDRLFEAAACYFPISFTPPPNDPFQISTHDLARRLQSVLSCNPCIGGYSITFAIEKLSSSLETSVSSGDGSGDETSDESRTQVLLEPTRTRTRTRTLTRTLTNPTRSKG